MCVLSVFDSCSRIQEWGIESIKLPSLVSKYMDEVRHMTFTMPTPSLDHKALISSCLMITLTSHSVRVREQSQEKSLVLGPIEYQKAASVKKKINSHAHGP